MVSCIFALCIIDGIRYDCGGDTERNASSFFSYFLFPNFYFIWKTQENTLDGTLFKFNSIHKIGDKLVDHLKMCINNTLVWVVNYNVNASEHCALSLILKWIKGTEQRQGDFTLNFINHKIQLPVPSCICGMGITSKPTILNYYSYWFGVYPSFERIHSIANNYFNSQTRSICHWSVMRTQMIETSTAAGKIRLHPSSK